MTSPIPRDRPSVVTASSLLTDLVSYWSLEEASGTRMDAHGTNHLTPANTPTSAVGKVGNACQLVGASTQYLSHADPTPLGDVDFTYALWFKTTLTGVYQGLVNKQNAYCLRLQDYGMGFFLGDSTPGIVNGPNIADTNWHFVVAWHDAAGNTLNLQLDNAVPASSPTTGPVPAGLSVLVGLGLGASFTGLIDELGLWRRVLTAAERTALYNAGAGLAYPFGPSEPPPSGAGSSAIDRALLALLAGDTTLMALTPDGVFWDEAPPHAKRFVLVSLLHEADEPMFGSRAYEAAHYLVKAVMLSTAGGDIAAAADRIDVLLEGAQILATGYTPMLTARDERIRFTEVDALDDTVRWLHRGGQYLVWMSL